MIPNDKDTYRKKHYGPQRSRDLKSALAQRIEAEFPRIGGPRMIGLCADIVAEVVESHILPLENQRHGQVLWRAIDLEDRPRRGQTAARTRTVPVLLTLHHQGDLEACIQPAPSKTRWKDLKLKRALRMCEEAYAQGALLSNIDLSLLLNMGETEVATMLSGWERANQKVIPRRTTLHDVGSGVTHKVIICRKRHLEGKDPAQVARETRHSLKAVEDYLGQYARVRECRKLKMSKAETAHILNCGEALVEEYYAIDDAINAARAAEEIERGKTSVDAFGKEAKDGAKEDAGLKETRNENLTKGDGGIKDEGVEWEDRAMPRGNPSAQRPEGIKKAPEGRRSSGATKAEANRKAEGEPQSGKPEGAGAFGESGKPRGLGLAPAESRKEPLQTNR